MTLKEGDRLITADAYGKVVTGEARHEYEVVAVEEEDDRLHVELKKLN